MSSNTQRSLAYYRKAGYTCDRCEYWIPQAKRRKDLFGFADIACVREGELLLVQSTSWGNISARLRKIREAPAAQLCLSVDGVSIQVQGWKKKGRYWVSKEREVIETDFWGVGGAEAPDSKRL